MVDSGRIPAAFVPIVLVQDDTGASGISYDHFAAAVLDEVEQPEHVGRRFTLGY